MAQLGLTTRKREVMRLFLVQAMAVVVCFFIMMCTLVAKYKRRGDDLLEGINDAAMKLGDVLIRASTTMVRSEVELQKKTSMVYSEILKMRSLSGLEKFKAFRKIVRKPSDVLLFWDFEEKMREDWVRFMLDQ